MKILLALLILSFNGSAWADCKSAVLQSTRVSFNYASFNVAYHCDFVKRESQLILQKLGALDVDVRCYGGLPYDRRINVEASFTRNVGLEGGERSACNEEVNLSFNNNSCDLHERIIDELVEGFEYEAIEKDVACNDPLGGVYYNISVLK